MRFSILVAFVLTVLPTMAQTHYVELTDTTFETGDIIRLRKPIRFLMCNDWFDEIVDDTSHIVLDELAVFLLAHKELKVEIGSHTDTRGTAAKNDTLSQGRADAIRKLLIKKGVPEEQMTAHGYGESTPVVAYLFDSTNYSYRQPENGTYETVSLDEAYINHFFRTDRKRFEQLHSMNRRTEVKIVAIKESE